MTLEPCRIYGLLTTFERDEAGALCSCCGAGGLEQDGQVPEDHAWRMKVDGAGQPVSPEPAR